MISLKEIRPNVFELTESILGFNDTKTTLWYWDIERKLLSEKSDFPKGMLTRPLTEKDLDRFERHYKPLVARRVSV